jgi:hypothetical protein
LRRAAAVPAKWSARVRARLLLARAWRRVPSALQVGNLDETVGLVRERRAIALV